MRIKSFRDFYKIKLTDAKNIEANCRRLKIPTDKDEQTLGLKSDRVIYIDEDFSGNSRKKLFWHEVWHTVEDHYRIEHDDGVADMFAEFMVKFPVSNKGFNFRNPFEGMEDE